MSAYLLRFSQLRMSGYFSAIHGGTYQPMMPSLPVRPASTTVPCSSMYFLTRSGWPQFSTMVSIEPSDMPCQPTSSLTSGYSTLQPSSFSATLPITCALETYPVHGLTAMFELTAVAGRGVVRLDVSPAACGQAEAHDTWQGRLRVTA